MLVLWREKLAFLAVPKTGTTAIEAALAPYAAIAFVRPPNVKHMTHRRFDRFIRPYLDKAGLGNVETLAVMREPVDWLGSWYRYRQRDAIAGTAKSTAALTFDQFVEAYLDDGRRADFADIGSQAKFLAQDQKVIRLDHLYRYENMPALVDFLGVRLGQPLSLPALNVSPKRDIALAGDLRRELESRYHTDFDLWASIA